VHLETENAGMTIPNAGKDLARCNEKYFSSTDWWSFVLAAVIAFIGYWFSLATDVGLENSGIYSVAAKYAGVPSPPGYPLWTIYAWLFTKLLPFSNIAWRVTVSSAVAGALVCGVIALMTSRGSVALLAVIPNFRRLALKDEQRLRLVAGAIAGVTFGFHDEFWRSTVIVDVWPLSILLLSLVLCLLMRWTHQPENRNYFHAACFTFGLTITNSQALIPTGLGLLFLVALTDENLGRDAALVAGVLLIGLFAGHFLDYLPEGGRGTAETKFIIILILLTTVGLWLVLAIRTHRLRPSRTIFLGLLLFLGGTFLYLLVPIFSMTNPPVNWGYPRTLEGFFHVLSRGQFEHIMPTSSFKDFAAQMLLFAGVTMNDFGLLPTVLALIPFGVFFRLESTQRRWLLGLSSVFVSLSFLMVALLNPPMDRQAAYLVSAYFSAASLVLALLMGYGFVLLGTILSRPPE